MGRYLCPLVEAHQCLFLFFQTRLFFTIFGGYVNWSSYILDTIFGSIYYLCLKIAYFLHIFSQALEHLHISSECLSDQFDSLVLSLWDWQRKIFSRDLLFALTPTSWVARCLARTRRYAANLRPGQSICYSPLWEQPKARQQSKTIKQTFQHFTRFTRWQGLQGQGDMQLGR